MELSANTRGGTTVKLTTITGKQIILPSTASFAGG